MLKSFAKYAAQERSSGGAHVGTLAAFVMDDLYMDHFIDNYIYCNWLNYAKL